jgi:hypothetical protein
MFSFIGNQDKSMLNSFLYIVIIGRDGLAGSQIWILQCRALRAHRRRSQPAFIMIMIMKLVSVYCNVGRQELDGFQAHVPACQSAVTCPPPTPDHGLVRTRRRPAREARPAEATTSEGSPRLNGAPQGESQGDDHPPLDSSLTPTYLALVLRGFVQVCLRVHNPPTLEAPRARHPNDSTTNWAGGVWGGRPLSCAHASDAWKSVGQRPVGVKRRIRPDRVVCNCMTQHIPVYTWIYDYIEVYLMHGLKRGFFQL